MSFFLGNFLKINIKGLLSRSFYIIMSDFIYHCSCCLDYHLTHNMYVVNLKYKIGLCTLCSNTINALVFEHYIDFLKFLKENENDNTKTLEDIAELFNDKHEFIEKLKCYEEL